MSFSPFQKAMTACLLLAALLLSACGAAARPEQDSLTPPPIQMVVTPEPTVTPPPTPEPPRASLRIAEVMAKNLATLRDEDGDFSDWIEIENYGKTAVELEGFRLTDRENRPGLALSGSLGPGERRLYWASGKDRAEDGHGDFSLSADETVSLMDPYGRAISAAPCLSAPADHSVSLGEDGEYALCLYPTPGLPNTREAYDAWQETLKNDSPLQLREICVYNTGSAAEWRLRGSDWVELKNVSDRAVELSDYCLSDDGEDYGLWPFPQKQLMPGAIYLVRCDDLSAQVHQGDPCTGFSLDAGAEQIYLSRTDGTLVDWAPVRGVPYGGSMGRMDGENGWFYFAATTPAADNSGGCRRVSAQPTLRSPDGVFNGVKKVKVELEGEGKIYYAFGDKVPTEESERYEKPFTLEKTAVVRAIGVEEGALPSRPAVFNYIINENHTLPVVSLVADSRKDFVWMYSNGNKLTELPVTLSLYEEDGGGFTVSCGVRMHGETSLSLEKKNMSIRFRSVYGPDMLQYDIYGGGVDRFRNLVLRAGQDYYATVIKNAAAQNLCLQAGNRTVTGRSRFCVLYVNGEYLGIYNLMEKTNEQLYADAMGVSRDSVEVIESQASGTSSIYQDVFLYCRNHDLTVPEYYEHVEELVDFDSVIDWVVLQGYCANTDLTIGNVRYAHSTEGDAKWRLMFYDLDAAFWDSSKSFVNMFDGEALYVRQVGNFLIAPLLRNPDFRDRLLRRAGALFETVLSTENVTAEFERLAALVEPEIERDYTSHRLPLSKWHYDMDYLRGEFADDAWNRTCIQHICQLLQLTDEERAEYFGE